MVGLKEKFMNQFARSQAKVCRLVGKNMARSSLPAFVGEAAKK